MNDIELIAQNNLEKALQVIEKSNVRQAWESIGATVNQVGSMAMGLLMKHRDIDFHIYTEELNAAESFNVIQKLCANPAVTRMEYRNLADTEEACLEFHVWYMLDEEEWQIDMIQILKGSQFDGFFEHVAQKIKEALTPETRKAILELKYLTPDDEHIMGIEYYQAVIADGIRSYPEFIQWRKNHSANGIVTWCP
jgi:predicted nucleotidyltransferase